jgi:molybdenum cofactor synthesis domain-containing protein
MEAEIITIGTELLLGEIVDTNTRTIALSLREIGLDIYRTSTVGDNAERIAQAVKESMSRAQVVITTGGLGPTVDDATREGIALALGVETEFRPELWDQIVERFSRFGRTPTENNLAARPSCLRVRRPLRIPSVLHQGSSSTRKTPLLSPFRVSPQRCPTYLRLMSSLILKKDLIFMA